MGTSAVIPQFDPTTGERVKPAGAAASPQFDPNTGERIKTAAPLANAGAGPGTQSTMQKIGNFAGDVGKGLGESAVSLMSTGDEFARKHLPTFLTNSNFGFGPPANLQHIKDMATPANTTQAVAKGAGDAAQFLIPGDAEKVGAAKVAEYLPRLGKLARPLADTAIAGLSSGAVNKAQGGDFSTGAAAGAAGSVVGQGLRAAAPAVAEKALGIRGKFDRAFNKAPGEAALTETTGIRPETIASQARAKIGDLSGQVENMADRASVKPNPFQVPEGAAPLPRTVPNRVASLTPARGVISDAIGQAGRQNAEGMARQLGDMSDTLSRRFDTHEPIPSQVTPRELLDLRRGFNEEHGRWNPELRDSTVTTGRRAYGALTDEFHNVLPQAGPLDQRISSLIPVKNRASIVALHDTPLQKGLARFGAHTGALTLGAAGAGEGYHKGGLPGAIAGGLTGVLAPELIASPEGQMIAARTMNKAGSLRPVVGSLLQADRDKKVKK